MPASPRASGGGGRGVAVRCTRPGLNVSPSSVVLGGLEEVRDAAGAALLAMATPGHRPVPQP